MMLCPLLPALLALSALTPAELRLELAQQRRHARVPLPELADAELARLLGGEVLGLFLPPRGEQPGAALGLVVSELDRDALWRALRDPRLDGTPQLVEECLARRAEGDTEVLHQVLSLPWPFGARHWVVEVQTHTALAAVTGDRGWERAWDLAPGGEAQARQRVLAGASRGLDASRLAQAIYTPVNRGAWSMWRLADGRTLLGFQVTTVVGGVIPDALVARYSVARMGELLRGLEARARALAVDPGASPPLLHGGDGRPLPWPGRAPGLAQRGGAGRRAL